MELIEVSKEFVYFKTSVMMGSELGADWVNSKRCYKIPINLHSVGSLLKHVKDKDLEILEELHLKLDNHYEVCYNIKSKEDTQGDERLRNYQRVDVEFINTKNNVGVFNEQRTGKTPTILLGTENLVQKNIVVVPSGLILNWKREIEIWCDSSHELFIVRGSPKKREAIYNAYCISKRGTLIMSYGTLRNDIDKILCLEKQFDVLIVDEAHRLRNTKTKQTKAVIKLGRKCLHRYPMTGTPAVNHASDVFGSLKLLNPKKFTSFWNFVDRYFKVYEGAFGKDIGGLIPERVEEFQSMLSIMSVQRKRRDIMKWLPKVQRRLIELPFSTKQRKLYDQILKTYRYEDKVVNSAIVQLMRLRQVALAPRLLDIDIPSEKTTFIKEYISDNPDEVILIFSSFTSYLYRLKTEFSNVVMLTGRQSLKDKQASVDNIQGGTSNLILANIIAGGVGWTLDKVDTIIFTDRSYNPMDNAQAEDRFIPTQEGVEYGGKQIIDLVMEDSVELSIRDALDRKINIVKYVNDYGLKEFIKTV